MLREIATKYKKAYGHNIPVDRLSSFLADQSQLTTQTANQRAFGVGIF